MLLVALSGRAPLRSPRREPARADGKPLEPMAVSQLEQSGTDAPAQTVPRPLQTPRETTQTLRPLTVTQLDDQRRAEEMEGGRTFSLSFSEATPIKDLLLLLVRDTTLSIAPDPDIEGTFIGELKNVTVRQALELILPPLSLDYSVQGNFIRVFRSRLETRIFDVNYVLTRRSGQRSVSASSAVGGGGGSSRDGQRSQESGDLFAELTGGIQTLLSAGGQVQPGSEGRAAPGHRLPGPPRQDRRVPGSRPDARLAPGADSGEGRRGRARRSARGRHRLDRRSAERPAKRQSDADACARRPAADSRSG